MQLSQYYRFLLLGLYGSLLLAAAAYFFTPDPKLLQQLSYRLPLKFMLQLSTFWFGSFVLAILFFLFHLKRLSFFISDAEQNYALRMGRRLFGMGATVAALLLLSLASFSA